ncbi:glycosyltransferase family 2 protein [Bifidobacterium felsineum]|uniref:glycosyltransferase family 2 protein n=1 Tax=Bifidobacterium felsineum TaxID=2045440 RepID=UPI001BDC7682|nr:glycosyltransferase family 2 protein [Bifidobacterium felsineum]MBT1164730.1 glycosyltransferase family 2 protein [Bifidobacterium felsineum]
MEHEPLVSIIIPIYKVEQFLDACVASVAAQTYRNLEILLVDDGSPDSCPAMCDAWAAKDSRVRVIHKTNGGLSDARNAGIKQATGSYIYFADSDDTVAPTLVEDCLEAMREYDADLVMFQFDTISESGKTLLSNYRHNDFSKVQILTPVEAIKKQVKAEIDGYFWAFLAPARTYQNTGFSFPVGRKIEDLSRICNVIGEATRVVRIPKVLYHYRMREGSITASWDPKLTRDWTKAADDREAYIIERFPELKGFMTLQQLNFFANLDYETIRQSLIAGLKIDPEDADAIRRHIERLSKTASESDEPIPDTLRELLGLLKLGVAKFADNAVDALAATPDAEANETSMWLPLTKEQIAERWADTANTHDGTHHGQSSADNDMTLAERFRDMREDWRQLRIQHIEQAEERKDERKAERIAARNGVTFEQE